MSAKRQLKKMQRQRRAAKRSSRLSTSSDHSELIEVNDIADDDDPNFIFNFDPATGTASALAGLFASDFPVSSLLAHIIRNNGLVADRLPVGALAKMLRESACPTIAKNDAMTLRDDCEAWYRWPVGHGLYIDLRLYHAHGRLKIPETLVSHPEVEEAINDILAEHYMQQPQFHRVLCLQGVEKAAALINAIPIHLYVIED